MDMLQVQNLCKSFGGLKAVNHCSFSVEKNSLTGLIGPNGAGKTTAFDLINGLLRADAGHILIKNQAVTHWPTHRRIRLGMGRTFQAIRIFPEFTVLENIIVALKNPREKIWHAFFPLKKIRSSLAKQALPFLEEIDLAEKAHLKACELSYGQKKLLELARVRATNADLILLDEPAAGINPTMLKRIQQLLLTMHQEGKTLFIVEHNMPFIMAICQKIIVMDHGQELAIGTPAEIQRNPQVMEAYLGKKSGNAKSTSPKIKKISAQKH